MTTPAKKLEGALGLWDFLSQQDKPGGRPPAELPSPNNRSLPRSPISAQADAPATSSDSFTLSEDYLDRGAATLCDEDTWLYAVQRLQSAVWDAHVRAGQSSLPAKDACALPARATLHKLGIVEAVTWRVEALGLQLRPVGAIVFRPIQPFEDTPAQCSLCGETLRRAERWVCLECQFAKNLALGFLDVDEWLCRDLLQSETV